MEQATKEALIEINRKLDGLTELMERLTRQEERNNSHSRRIEALEKEVDHIKEEYSKVNSALEKIINRIWGIAAVLSVAFTVLQVFLK